MSIEQAKADFEFAQRRRTEEIERAEERFDLALEVFYFVISPTDSEARSVDFDNEAELSAALRDKDQKEDVVEALEQIVDARIAAAQAAGA